MKKLNLPSYNFKFKTVNQKTQIFDSIRKKYIALTPEEWVRQNFICFLVEEKKYPTSLIAVESGLKYHSQKKKNRHRDLFQFRKTNYHCGMQST